jgi:mannose-P-dolichol utilization defect 1
VSSDCKYHISKLTEVAVLSARSARGLSLPAYIIETLAYAITLTYSFRNDFPFSTYGENLFLAIQNTLITLLIIYYPTPSLRRSQDIRARLLVACFATFVSAIALYVLPKEALALLQLATLPLSVFSKLPQILQNSRAQSTGQLSAFAVISQIAGCVARLFTTATEVGDLLVTASFALALLLNCIVGAQMWIYWGKDEREKDSDLGRPSLITKEEKESLDIVKPVRSPAVSYVPQQHSASGRKWARKVD